MKVLIVGQNDETKIFYQTHLPSTLEWGFVFSEDYDQYFKKPFPLDPSPATQLEFDSCEFGLTVLKNIHQVEQDYGKRINGKFNIVIKIVPQIDRSPQKKAIKTI